MPAGQTNDIVKSGKIYFYLKVTEREKIKSGHSLSPENKFLLHKTKVKKSWEGMIRMHLGKI